jgi:hypothetical protein
MTPQGVPDAYSRLMIANAVSGEPAYLDLSYHTCCPYSVFMLVNDQKLWVCCRTLLLEGCRKREGMGDVVVAPINSRNLLILIKSPDGKYAMRVPMDDVITFLDATFQLVPDGDEAKYLDWDKDLTALYRGRYGKKWKVDP